MTRDNTAARGMEPIPHKSTCMRIVQCDICLTVTLIHPNLPPEVVILEVRHQVVTRARLGRGVDAHAVETHNVGVLDTAQHLGFFLTIHAGIHTDIKFPLAYAFTYA